MKQIPFLLIISRLLFGFVVITLAIFKPQYYSNWIITLLFLGLLSDVFDGIIARKMNIATEKLRVWDSNVDMIFWLCVIGSIFYLKLCFIKLNYAFIIILIGLEAMAYLVSYIKFKRTIATHSILAKFWTLTLLVFLIDLMLNSTSTWWFHICIGLGIISRLEIILIILQLNKWTTDVPSILVVGKINAGLPFKKWKLFN